MKEQFYKNLEKEESFEDKKNYVYQYQHHLEKKLKDDESYYSKILSLSNISHPIGFCIVWLLYLLNYFVVVGIIIFALSSVLNIFIQIHFPSKFKRIEKEIKKDLRFLCDVSFYLKMTNGNVKHIQNILANKIEIGMNKLSVSFAWGDAKNKVQDVWICDRINGYYLRKEVELTFENDILKNIKISLEDATIPENLEYVEKDMKDYLAN